MPLSWVWLKLLKKRHAQNNLWFPICNLINHFRHTLKFGPNFDSWGHLLELKVSQKRNQTEHEGTD